MSVSFCFWACLYRILLWSGGSSFSSCFKRRALEASNLQFVTSSLNSSGSPWHTTVMSSYVVILNSWPIHGFCFHHNLWRVDVITASSCLPGPKPKLSSAFKWCNSCECSWSSYHSTLHSIDREIRDTFPACSAASANWAVEEKVLLLERLKNLQVLACDRKISEEFNMHTALELQTHLAVRRHPFFLFRMALSCSCFFTHSQNNWGCVAYIESTSLNIIDIIGSQWVKVRFQISRTMQLSGPHRSTSVHWVSLPRAGDCYVQPELTAVDQLTALAAWTAGRWKWKPYAAAAGGDWKQHLVKSL